MCLRLCVCLCVRLLVHVCVPMHLLDVSQSATCFVKITVDIWDLNIDSSGFLQIVFVFFDPNGEGKLTKSNGHHEPYCV